MIADNDDNDLPSMLIPTAHQPATTPTPTSMAPTDSHYDHHCHLDVNSDDGSDVSVPAW